MPPSRSKLAAKTRQLVETLDAEEEARKQAEGDDDAESKDDDEDEGRMIQSQHKG